MLGFVSYGMSLVCFIVGLRHVGAARTGAYFSTAPFIGALIAGIFLREQFTVNVWVAGALMLASNAAVQVRRDRETVVTVTAPACYALHPLRRETEQELKICCRSLANRPRTLPIRR